MARVGYSCALWEIPPRYKRALLNEFCKLTQIHSTKMYRLMLRDSIQEINRKIPIDLIVYTKAEYELLQRYGISFLREIEIVGKILPEKTSE